MASGLIQVLMGSATKLLPFLDGEKEYLAGGVLGLASDSLDACGRIERRVSMRRIKSSEFRVALRGLRGQIMQVPPALSAKKQNGRRGYQLFREGKRAKFRACPVVIRALSLVSYQYPGFIIRVRCSSGTYVRSLIRDIGTVLGGAACLYCLRRTAIGPFSVAQARAEASWRKSVMPLERILPRLIKVRARASGVKRIRVGQAMRPEDYTAQLPVRGRLVRITSPQGMLAVGEVGPDRLIQVKRLLN
jgi:tRNA pseudouridine(55) synthase